MQKLQCSRSAWRDLRTWLILLVGVGFLWAGATVDPATNCDGSGRQCAPWLVPVAFCMGLVGTAMALGLLAFNRKWGSRLDLTRRTLYWWDSAMSAETFHIALDRVTRIKVQHISESSVHIFFYDRDGSLIRFNEENAIPYDAERWAHDLACHYPHLSIEVEEK